MSTLYRKTVGTLLASGLLLLISGCAVIGLDSDDEGVTRAEKKAHKEDVENWKEARDERLRSESGWLTLIGLEWLKQGETRIGSNPGNDIVIANSPGYWGSVFLNDNKLRFVTAAGVNVSVNDEYLEEAPMVADTEGDPTIVRSGTISFYPIFRQSYGLRIKDSQAATRLDFDGIDHYGTELEWRIEGDFERAEEGETIEIGNVLGQINPEPMYGTFVFQKDGRTHRLRTIGDEESDSLFIIFADRTSGRETYGAGRFLYSDMPVDGRLTVDFNKAYNPPCAFNEYSTCPLPPPENRLNLAVTVGERNYQPE